VRPQRLFGCVPIPPSLRRAISLLRAGRSSSNARMAEEIIPMTSRICFQTRGMIARFGCNKLRANLIVPFDAPVSAPPMALRVTRLR
jgi:hypothetical protein